jgi:antitoxin component YwqK of YwqJK toxin-antitoxin module
MECPGEEKLSFPAFWPILGLSSNYLDGLQAKRPVMKNNRFISIIFFIAVLQLGIVLSGCAEKREETYPNGKIRLCYSAKEVDGNFLKHGMYSTWYPDGTKEEEIEYERGKKQGKYLSWHENGAKYEEIEYENDEKHGNHNWWYDNGAKGGRTILQRLAEWQLHQMVF